MRKFSIILIIAIGICFIGGFIYFVGGVSATIPPIRKYEFKGSIIQLANSLYAFSCTNPNMKYKVSARDSSNLKVNYRDIEIKINEAEGKLFYALDCEQNEHHGSIYTEMDLVEARNTTDNTGGYGESADGMEPLLKYFDKDLVFKINKEQHVDIHVKKEGFFERIHIY